MKPIKPYKYFPKPGPVAEITKEYRWYLGNGGTPLNYRVFAELLSLPLKEINRSISPTTIRAWEIGQRTPRDVVLESLISKAAADSWQHNFARDLRAAIAPGTYTPCSEIGKRALSSRNTRDSHHQTE